jgi:hypothetical protein
MGFGEETAEVGVSRRGFGQQGDMVAALRLVDARKTPLKSDFGARDGLELRSTGGVGELHGAVEPVVVGEREGRVAEFHRARNEFLGMGGTIQKGKA